MALRLYNVCRECGMCYPFDTGVYSTWSRDSDSGGKPVSVKLTSCCGCSVVERLVNEQDVLTPLAPIEVED